MRGFMLKMLVCLLALNGLVLRTADAAQRTRQRKVTTERPNQSQAYSLEDVMKSPREFLEREVVFYCRFATTANLFKNINTRFNSTNHVNFAVWPDKAVLWETKGRRNILPTLYIAKNDPDTLAVLHDVGKYELVAVTGRVLNVYAGFPWILVTKMEKIEKPNERLSEQVIEHMQAGYDSLKAEAGGAAARHFEQALQFGLPCEYRPKAYEHLAQAYLIENKLDRARGYLRQAVEIERNDPVLHLALADVALRMGDAGEALAHAQFALERSGKYPQAYGIKGEAMSLLGDYAKAFAELNTAAGTPGITAREKAMVNVRRARIYVRSDRYPDAAKVYAAVSEPGEPLSAEGWVHNEIGLFYERLYLESGDPRYLDSAFSAFEEGAKLARLDPSIQYNQAEVEFRRQRLSESPDMDKVMALIDKVYLVQPDYPPARVLQGRVLYQMGRLEEAEHIYQTVSQRIGTDAEALLAISEAYLDLCRFDDALMAVSTACSLQPWSYRVQALGELIEEAASMTAASRGFSFQAQRQYTNPVYQSVPSAPAPQAPAPKAAPQAQPQAQPQAMEEVVFDETRYYYNEKEGVYYEKESPELHATKTPTARKGANLPSKRKAAGKQLAQAEVEPAPAANPRAGVNVIAAAANSQQQTMALRPPEGKNPLGVSSRGLIPRDAPAARNNPLRPEATPAVRRNRFPVTEVRLPEKINPSRGRSTASSGSRRRIVDGGSGPVEGLDLGYTPGGKSLIAEMPTGSKLITEDFADEFGDEFDEEFGESYEWEGEEREVEVDEEGYLDFGMVKGVTGAYASLPVGGMEAEERLEADGVRIPPPFTFEPDTSPVIIADVRTSGVAANDRPVRNANLYRRYAGGRRPAEIIEKERVAPYRHGDAQTMIAPATPPTPAGGNAGLPRTEVRLPSSPHGIGMASDFSPIR